MSSGQASLVKRAGHRNELDFASLIGGEVNLGSHTDKKDVIDRQHRSHSVKAGKWWQIFLYGRERLRTNTIFQGLGEVANIMIACIDAYPLERSVYLQNKDTAKRRLQPHMRQLLEEIKKPHIFKAFLDKALFDGGNAEYLSMFIGPAVTPISDKHFHVFHKNDVIDTLAADVTLRNSKAISAGQMDDQKVTFLSTLHNKNIGEIEDRHDSDSHYLEMKFRLCGPLVFDILTNCIHVSQQVAPQITTHGRAVRMFKM